MSGALEPAQGPRKPSPWLLYVAPLLFVVAVLLSAVLPGFLEDPYVDFALPFFIATWIGAGFTFAWDSLRHGMHAEKFSPAMTAATGLLVALIFLVMLGPDSIWQEPWLFGAAIFPGITLARPWLERQLLRP